MEKDIQAQTPLAVKFKLQPGDSRYVRYVEENHHESLRKKSFNPNYHPNELKYSQDEKDPTTVITDIHFEKKSVAYEAYHLSHGFSQ